MGNNPLRTIAAIGSGGVSELLLRGQEADKPLDQIESQKKPPTLDDAKVGMDQSQLQKKSYGRAGTIRNTGGSSGLASSVLNLSTPTLMGK